MQQQPRIRCAGSSMTLCPLGAFGSFLCLGAPVGAVAAAFGASDDLSTCIMSCIHAGALALLEPLVASSHLLRFSADAPGAPPGSGVPALALGAPGTGGGSTRELRPRLLSRLRLRFFRRDLDLLLFRPRLFRLLRLRLELRLLLRLL